MEEPGLALEQGATDESEEAGDPELLTAGGRP
jgi:hypothetical protein